MLRPDPSLGSRERRAARSLATACDRPTRASGALVRPVSLLVCIVLVGCASPEPMLGTKSPVSPPSDVVVERMWTRDGISEFEVINLSDRPVQYLHWLGQASEPVAYCLRQDASEWTCPEREFAVGDKHLGYMQWSEEGAMGPHSKMTFRARAGTETPVGIRVLPVGSSRAKLVVAN